MSTLPSSVYYGEIIKTLFNVPLSLLLRWVLLFFHYPSHFLLWNFMLKFWILIYCIFCILILIELIIYTSTFFLWFYILINKLLYLNYGINRYHHLSVYLPFICHRTRLHLHCLIYYAKYFLICNRHVIKNRKKIMQPMFTLQLY